MAGLVLFGFGFGQRETVVNDIIPWHPAQRAAADGAPEAAECLAKGTATRKLDVKPTEVERFHGPRPDAVQEFGATADSGG